MPQRTTNLVTAVEAALPSGTFAVVKAIADRAFAIDMPLYLVGGSVRDVLLGLPLKDIDMVVEGNAAELAFEAAKEMSGAGPTYSQFGTATVKIGGHRFDLATARQETYLRPGALPRVTPSTILEDLGRRDFSINAMAIGLSGPERGRLLDPHRWQDDLRHGLIRILHQRSFLDDPTRILRAVRYEKRLGFRVEQQTHRSLVEAVDGGMLDTVSGARIRRELELMFGEERPYAPLSRCGNLGILRGIFGPLGDGAAVRAIEGHVPDDVPLTYLAAMAYPLAPQEGEAFIHRLGMPTRWAKVVRDTISVRLRCGGDPDARPQIGEPDLLPGQLSGLLDQYSPVSVQVSGALSESSPVKDAIGVYLTKLRYVKPSLSGTDLISMGVAQGPLVGEILSELKAARIEGRVTSRDEEVHLAQKYATSRGSQSVG